MDDKAKETEIFMLKLISVTRSMREAQRQLALCRTDRNWRVAALLEAEVDAMLRRLA